MSDETPVVLDPSADPVPELVDHPDEVTEEQAAEGQRVYLAVDDTDDDSNGLDT